MSPIGRLPLWWRHALLAGAAFGLIAASLGVPAPAGWPAVLAAPLLLLTARARRPASPPAALALFALALLSAAIAGIGIGQARLAAIDAGGFRAAPGTAVRAAGFVIAPPRSSLGELRVPLETPDGRLVVVAREPTDLGVGDALRVRGRLAEPEPFRSDELSRLGAAMELRAERLRRIDAQRSGLTGALDRARDRAERGLAAGLDPERAALARGFVLGQDDRIDPLTREEFRRSGLAHLLAVSGQNVMLLAILAGVLLAVAGVGPRSRLALILLAIAAYVPIAGAGPSILRAGVMGAAGIIAGLAGRPADRLFALLAAAAATLAINPRLGADVGWQLSFAAVIGIALWTRPLRAILIERLDRLPERLRVPLAEGAALTIAATAATAPLMAHHFEAFSLASLPANLLALPAVAPVMWLGMAAAMLGQIPLAPTAPIAVVEGPLLAYIATVAELLAAPDWALIELPGGSLPRTLAAYAALLLIAFLGLRALARRSGTTVGGGLRTVAAVAALLALAPAALGSSEPAPPRADALRITQLDVGQGDAILLQQGGRAALVDTGPPGAGLARLLAERGVSSLDAVFITHDQLDHAGGLAELGGRVRYRRLILAAPAPAAESIARQAGATVRHTAEGGSFELGSAAITVLWPPPAPPGEGALQAAPAAPLLGDPNARSLILSAEHAGYRALLTGDAEFEQTHLDPGPLDTLKLAHHGSADAGLERLLDRSAPRVALIGVGAANRHGHPTEEALASLAERAVCVLRTDLDGSVWVELGPGGLAAGGEHESWRGRAGCGPGPHLDSPP